MLRWCINHMTAPRTLKHIHDDLKKKFPDKNLLPGHGHTQATIVLVSGAPGSDEERSKKPLAGKHGQLLNQLLKGAGIDKRKVYITNTIKHRLDAAIATPTKEIRAHAAFLKEELRTINPHVVITLGDLALSGMGFRQPLHNVHGKTFAFGAYELVPTFHPENALRDPNIKDLLQADFIKVRDLLKAKKEKPAL